MVRINDDEPRPEVLKTGFRSRKRMVFIFFNTQGHAALDSKPHKATINVPQPVKGLCARSKLFCIMIRQHQLV